MITLLKIYSTHLLKDIVELNQKATFLLCKLKDTSLLLNLNQQKGATMNDLMWMDYTMLKKAQKSNKLLGIEPLTLYKRIKEGNLKKNIQEKLIYYKLNF